MLSKFEYDLQQVKRVGRVLFVLLEEVFEEGNGVDFLVLFFIDLGIRNEFKPDKKIFDVFLEHFWHFDKFLPEIEFEFGGVLEEEPVVFSILIGDFGVVLEMKLTLIFVESHIVDVIEVVDKFLSIFPTKYFDFLWKWLFVQKSDFNNEKVFHDFKLPQNFKFFI